MNKCKVFFTTFVGVLIGLSISFFVDIANKNKGSTMSENKKDTIVVYKEVYHKVDWDTLYDAICWVESKGKTNAVGKTNDLGIAQITPIYVKQVNKILGEERYSLSDRKCPTKSREMFEIYQNYFNPNRDYITAIYLHNPRARMSYAKAIEDRYLYLMDKKKERV